jgi:hypothetical protein
MAISQRALWILGGLALLGGGSWLYQWLDQTRTEVTANAPSQPPPFLAGTPSAYLHDYVQADFQGDRLEKANWPRFKQQVVWPVEPNWETAYVIRSFRVQTGPVTGQQATVEVTYDTLGELNLFTFVYETSPTRQTVPYLLVPGDDRWKIGAPMLKPHVGPESAIAFLERMAVHYVQYRENIKRAIARIRADAGLPEPTK